MRSRHDSLAGNSYADKFHAMIKPAIPIDEELRLMELNSFAISETTEDAALNEIVWLASQMAQTPIAFISVVDFSRQWTKASLGFPLKESHRDLSFCAHVVANKAQLITNNATLDPRFCDNPLVLANPKIQFYAGFPLQTATGQVLGALCVAGPDARSLNENQIQALEYLSRQVMREFQLRKSNEELHQNGKDLQASLRQIQQQELELGNGARLGALGKLARGVAHEINNSLTIILGKTQMVMRSVHEGDLQKEQGEKNLDVILKSCEKIMKIIKGLSKFSRDGSEDSFEITKVITVVEEVLALFAQKIKKMNVHFEKMGPEDLELECRPIEISQVLINVIGHSLESLQENTDKQLKISWQKTNSGLELLIQDNRRKTSNDYRSPVMDLYLSKEICQSHRGQIQLETRGDLTLVTISLPVRQSARPTSGKDLLKAHVS